LALPFSDATTALFSAAAECPAAPGDIGTSKTAIVIAASQDSQPLLRFCGS
jgi:hypothetical protein